MEMLRWFVFSILVVFGGLLLLGGWLLMDKVWVHRLDIGLGGYGGSGTWEAFVFLERITSGETVCI